MVELAAAPLVAVVVQLSLLALLLLLLVQYLPLLVQPQVVAQLPLRAPLPRLVLVPVVVRAHPQVLVLLPKDEVVLVVEAVVLVEGLVASEILRSR